MSNIYPFLPKLTVNRQFLYDFIAAESPCFALGLVEERKRPLGFLALRPSEAIPPEITRLGFNFGHSLRGNAHFEVVHFAFEFYGFATYNVLVNPNNALVRTVLSTMTESGEYFFFAIDPDQRVTTFRSEMQDWEGLEANLDRIQRSTTTEAQYQQAVAQFRRNPEPPGQCLTWVCRDNAAYLDLTQDRLELNPSPESNRQNEPVDASRSPNWQPLSMLPTLAAVIDGQLADAEEQHATLLEVRECPYVLDDEIIDRMIRLYTEQLEYVPFYREQLGHWRDASPTKAQREDIARLAGQLERHEAVVQDILALAKELRSETIDAILCTDAGELGMAVFEGKIKPPSGEPLNDALRVAEQRAIANVLDARVEELEEAGVHDLELLGQMAPQLPMFHRLMEISSEAGINDLCQQYPGFFRFAKLLEFVAIGIRSGDIQVPR